MGTNFLSVFLQFKNTHLFICMLFGALFATVIEIREMIVLPSKQSYLQYLRKISILTLW